MEKKHLKRLPVGIQNRWNSKEVLPMNNIETNELDRTCGLTDDELTERFREAIRIDNEIKRVKGLPISRYD